MFGTALLGRRLFRPRVRCVRRFPRHSGRFHQHVRDEVMMPGQACGGIATVERLTRSPRGLGRYFPQRLLLGDHITHELDIVFALDREPEIEPDVVVAVLNTQVAVPNPFVPAFRNSGGPAASGDRRRVEPRRAGTGGRRPRSRTRVCAR